MNKQTGLRNFTRGGQITLHNIRMFIQISNKLTLILVGLFVFSFLLSAWLTTTHYERYSAGKYLYTKLISFLNPEVTTEFIDSRGAVVQVRFTDLQQSPVIVKTIDIILRKLRHALMASVITTFLAIIVIARWLKTRGKLHTGNEYLKGDSLVAPQILAKLIRSKHPCNLTFAQIPLPQGIECAHFLIHGTTGTGKSTAIKELLEQIRQRGDRAIIYDKSCNYLEEFFDPFHDVLLNPLDERCVSWHLWAECRDSADYDSLAAAQIPMPVSTQDPFWVNAARTIFSATAFEMRQDPNRNIIKLLRYLLTADLEKIQNYLKGTEAETLVSAKVEKTAISVKTVLATYLKSMKYIKDEEDPFSIRQWIQNDEASNWLFITSLGDRHETLKPLISCWLDIAVNALLSLPPNPQRRIWLILDELSSLQQLPYLTQALSEARKFGGCIVIGVQNYAQLAKVYGNDGAKEISALLNTRLMFREPDPELAKWSALNLGETVIEEAREGLSYGANTMRDGISVNRLETRKPVVTFSEIMCLPDLQAYLRLPGHYPLTRVSFKFKRREKINEAIKFRAIDKAQLKEISE